MTARRIIFYPNGEVQDIVALSVSSSSYPLDTLCYTPSFRENDIAHMWLKVIPYKYGLDLRTWVGIWESELPVEIRAKCLLLGV